MGNLLKEALKLVCGVNNNWSYAVFWKFGCQNPKMLIWEECYHGSLQNHGPTLQKMEGYNSGQVGDPLRILISKMMMSKQVNMMGEGLVGRAAFTGTHQWIVSGNYNGNAHPAEVLHEIHLQFSAGMQTIAVIPVIPHGVVQLASPLAMMENVGFVHDVKSVILQVVCVRNTFMSENYVVKNPLSLYGLPYDATSMQMNSTSSFNLPKKPSHILTHTNHSSNLLTQFQDNLHFSSSTVDDSIGHPNMQIDNQVNGGIVMSLKSGSLMNEQSCSNPDDFFQSKVSSVKDMVVDDGIFQSYTRDDLFDVLGVDFKNKLLNGNDSKLQNRLSSDTKDQGKNLSWSMNLQNPSCGSHSDYSERISESGVFCPSNSDHLLDAVISGVNIDSRQISDDNMSCKTTQSPSIPSLTGVASMSNQQHSQLFQLSMMRKNDSGNCSISSLTHGSQISLLEQRHSISVSTANSKKPNEAIKTNRKRLKPGENPRPRPKDRQMIQDRVKELREIVPNGAKCSIDALLERTIKHMVFLQSVTKHADKLKQTVESKITNKEDGTLLKDNLETGATWAIELGSQSTACPLVVEDLNPPRQLLIEMLCEERGFFLEIADIIRGLGLTILKGVMETRGDKIWARFVIEANRDVTRMEVFISLVHLVEQTLNPNNPTNNSIKAHSTSMGANEQLVGPTMCGGPSAL